MDRESFIRHSRTLLRAVGVGVNREIEKRKGKEPTKILHTVMYSHYAGLLGIKKGSLEEEQIKEVLPQIVDYWFGIDAGLDGDLPNARIIDENEVTNDSAFRLSVVRSKVPQNIREAVERTEYGVRGDTYKAYIDFMAKFDPNKTSYKDVMEYRNVTTGTLAEILGSTIALISGANGNISPILENMRREAICFQFIDDLVDCVADFRKQLPNLFNALLLENPSEKEKFESASCSQQVLRTLRPYAIAKATASETLTEYLRRFSDLASSLPPQRRELEKDLMASAQCLSYTPNALVPVSLLEVRNALRRGTRV